MKHKFFEILAQIQKEKTIDRINESIDQDIKGGSVYKNHWDKIEPGTEFTGPYFPKRLYFKTLKEAHPFIFDSKCSDRGITEAGIEFKPGDDTRVEKMETRIDDNRKRVERESLSVEEFSLPFANCLYVFTNPTILAQWAGETEEFEGDTLVKTTPPEILRRKMHGLLLNEITPEKINLFEIYESEWAKNKWSPFVSHSIIDLKNREDGNGELTICINRFTNMISVKRIGIEKPKSFFNLKTPGTGLGITKIKYDNIIHIADKEEYEYTRGLSEDVRWSYQGWWRGHWRAFYEDEKLTDVFGRRIVNYGRTGKDRSGNYSVPGYTWVIEHIRGEPTLAKIRQRIVVSK